MEDFEIVRWPDTQNLIMEHEDYFKHATLIGAHEEMGIEGCTYLVDREWLDKVEKPDDKKLNDRMQTSLKRFCKDIKKLLHKGTYQISHMYRDDTGKVVTAHMNIGDIRIVFRANEWTVNMPVEGNPVNPELLDSWDRQQIDWEINYHQEQLNTLKKRKEELG